MSNCVLIVEDNADLRALYQIALSNEGYEVFQAENGKMALDILLQHEINPKLIILDLMMPVMDGWEFLKQRSSNPFISAIPVVVCSASKDNVPNGVGFLKKPLDLNTLLNLVEDYCN